MRNILICFAEVSKNLDLKRILLDCQNNVGRSSWLLE